MLRSTPRLILSFFISTALIGCCQLSPTRAKEDVLRQDLKTLRDEIDNYTRDKEKRPTSLQDLVDSGYLRKIPKDPFTGSADTWRIEDADRPISLDETEPGISNVHSGSNRVGTDGTQYSTW